MYVKGKRNFQDLILDSFLPLKSLCVYTLVQGNIVLCRTHAPITFCPPAILSCQGKSRGTNHSQKNSDESGRNGKRLKSFSGFESGPTWGYRHLSYNENHQCILTTTVIWLPKNELFIWPGQLNWPQKHCEKCTCFNVFWLHCCWF